MKHAKMIPEYEAEINKLDEEYTEINFVRKYSKSVVLMEKAFLATPFVMIFGSVI